MSVQEEEGILNREEVEYDLSGGSNTSSSLLMEDVNVFSGQDRSGKQSGLRPGDETRWCGLFPVLFPNGMVPQKIRSAAFPEYDNDWKQTYDMFLLVLMLVVFVAMSIATGIFLPALVTSPGRFWAWWVQNLIRLAVMWFFAWGGGVLVVTTSIRVNYTRKIQHFAAYLVPLLADQFIETPIKTWEEWLILQIWGYYIVMFSFAIMIYPVRTNIRLVDLMFFSLDRPEDRPNTLKWITTQIMVGDAILVGFKFILKFALSNTAGEVLVFIPTLIVGIGDGLAEPVGITWGKHKYKARALCSTKAYTRSYEGSAAVFVTGVISCLAFYSFFENWRQYLVSVLLIPITMTLAEAISPHTWDTPCLMFSGCGLIVLVLQIP